MNRTLKGLLAAATALAALAGSRAQETPLAPPARDWTLPLFTREGYHQMTLKGDEVRQVSQDQFDISGMDVTVFSGGKDARVDTIIVSPAASFMINEKVAHGESAIRLIRDDIEVNGSAWTYYYNEKKVLIEHNAHVVFHAALPDILK